MQLFYVSLVQIELAHSRRDLGIGEDAELLATVHQALDLFEFLQFRY
jgi:hypothetical protein